MTQYSTQGSHSPHIHRKRSLHWCLCNYTYGTDGHMDAQMNPSNYDESFLSKYSRYTSQSSLLRMGYGVGFVSMIIIIMDSFFSEYSQETPHSSPVWARYWVSFMGKRYSFCPTVVMTMLYATACYIGLNKNSFTHTLIQHGATLKTLCV